MLVGQLVLCRHGSAAHKITKGNKYKILVARDEYVLVVCDDGRVRDLDKSLFKINTVWNKPKEQV